jgi:hypothetical protein
VTLLLKLSQLIDWLNERVARGAFWLVLVMTIICAANASYRFIFNDSSNGLLEIQWYLFAAVFLLCSPYTLQRAVAAAGCRVVQDPGNVVQRRRPDPLAGQDPAADRLHAARPAGHFRTDQAHRLPGAG